MKLSFDWLSDYVDLSGISVQELAEKLTMGAFEVEEVHTIGAEIEGPVVVGEIVEIHPHPNADKIRLTKTRVAPDQAPLEIVCGAQNIEVGQIIPVALPGARVIDRKTGGPLHIKASAIRGVQSNGMLCSPSELGVTKAGASEAEAGILILDREKLKSQLGADIRDLLALRPDYVLHVEPRSNRGDALSVIGLAREAAALLQRPLKTPQWSLDEFSKQDRDEQFTASIEDESDCPFLSMRLLYGLGKGALPAFMTQRLSNVGLRSVSPLVDITNYVMLELGQPLHAYDLRKISGGLIAVRRARPGEVLETLDQKKRELKNEVLVIADRHNIVGVAGVMGGKDSEISDSTTDVALEAAAFTAARVRRGSRLLGMSSDASLRFERGVDPTSVVRASDRAAYLMLKYCCGENAAQKLGGLYTAGSDNLPPKPVTLRLSALKRVLGADFTPNQVKELISPLGFTTERIGTVDEGEALNILVPSFRQSDVKREIDLVEEVCRLWGYDKLPVRMPASTIAATPGDTTFDRLRQKLAAIGFSEAMLSSLTGDGISPEGSSDEKPSAREAMPDPTEFVRVLNPLSSDHQVMRRSLLPGLTEACAYNHARGRKSVWLFEIGRIYLRDEGSPHGTGVVEPTYLAGIMAGDLDESSWTGNKTTLDFYRGKGVVENILSLAKLDLDKIRFVPLEADDDFWHPSKAAEIYFSHQPLAALSDIKGQAGSRQKSFDQNGDQNGNKVARKGEQKQEPKQGSTKGAVFLGRFGELHPKYGDAKGLKESAYLFELNLDALKSLGKSTSFKAVANTPMVLRDITADLPAEIDFGSVKAGILAEAGKNLQEVELVSVFKLSDQSNSLSFRLKLQHPEKTLTAEEIDALIDKVKAGLAKRFSASYRG